MSSGSFMRQQWLSVESSRATNCVSSNTREPKLEPSRLRCGQRCLVMGSVAGCSKTTPDILLSFWLEHPDSSLQQHSRVYTCFWGGGVECNDYGI